MILTKNNQKGSTMMETLGVLSIFVMLGAGAISLIGNIWNLFKQSMVVNEARDLQKAISDSYRAEGNYYKLFHDKDNEWSSSNEEAASKPLCVEKIAPFQMCSDNKLRHRLGGKVYVSPVLVDEESDNCVKCEKYMLTFTSLTKKACVALAQINWYTQKKSDIYQMRINYESEGEGLVVCLPGNNDDSCSEDKNIYNFSRNDAMGACNKSGNDNQIDWIFF